MFKNFIGIFGGTFNPVHNAHINIAVSIINYLQLQQIQFIPCAFPPHKTTGILPFDLRVTLLEIAIKNYPSLSINTLESTLSSPSYSWNMIHYWKELNPTYQPLFILSDEDFSQIDTWYKGIELPKITNFLIVPRISTIKKLFSQTLKKFWNCREIQTIKNKNALYYATVYKGLYCFFIDIPLIHLSSSLIREEWIKGIYKDEYLPNSVITYLYHYKETVKKIWK